MADAIENIVSEITTGQPADALIYRVTCVTRSVDESGSHSVAETRGVNAAGEPACVKPNAASTQDLERMFSPRYAL
jgi:hypothetical protein